MIISVWQFERPGGCEIRVDQVDKVKLTDTNGLIFKFNLLVPLLNRKASGRKLFVQIVDKVSLIYI